MRSLYCLFLIFILLGNSFSQDYWIRKSSPTTKILYKCSFVDTLNGWAAGDSGVVIHTSNGGINWSLQNSGIQLQINGLDFINSLTGWGIANEYSTTGARILKTTNGGINWANWKCPDTNNVYSSVYFLNTQTGFLCGTGGNILKSTNGGLNWSKCRIDFVYLLSSLPFISVSFKNETTGLACGGKFDFGGSIWRTTDTGENWYILDSTSEPIFHAMYYNDTLLFGTGGDIDFYGCSFSYSTNGGNYWVDSIWGYFGIGQVTAIRTLSDIWVPLGFSANWMYSHDTGKTWTKFTTSDTNSVYDAVFIDSMHGWAFGINGAIYKYNTELIGINNQGSEIPFSYILHQNYPNPFNPFTTIDYSIPKASHVRIILYDVLGREVKTLVSEYRQAGNHTIKFSAEGISSGVYFYKLESGDTRLTKKLIILK